jgi:hypothetical protein
MLSKHDSERKAPGLSIKEFHNEIRARYFSEGQDMKVAKLNSNRWKYSCGCGNCEIQILGRKKRTTDGGNKFFIEYVPDAPSTHINCTFVSKVVDHAKSAVAVTLHNASSGFTEGSPRQVKTISTKGPKQPRRDWSTLENRAVLEEAIEKITTKQASQLEISNATGISQSLLSKTLNGRRDLVSKLGRKAVIPDDLEMTIANYCLQLSETGWGIGRQELKSIARQVVKIYPQLQPGSTFSASNSWAQGFFNRHPRLASRRGQGFELRRASGLNPKACKLYFDILNKAIEDVKARSGGHFEIDLYANLDESAVALKDGGRTVCARAGSHDVHVLGFNRLCSSRMTSVNLICPGTKIYDPFYIFEGKDKKFMDKTQVFNIYGIYFTN